MRKPSPFFEGVKLRDLHRVYRAFVPHLRKYRRLFVLTYLALFASMLMNLLKPWPLKIVLDHIILDKAVPRRLEFLNSIVGHDKAILLAILCAGMVAIFLLEGLFTFIRKYFVEAAGERAINDIRQEVFGNLQTSELRTDRPGDLIVRLTSDVGSMKLLLTRHVQTLVNYIFTFSAICITMFWMDWRLTLLALTVAPPLYLISIYFSPKRAKKAWMRLWRVRGSAKALDEQRRSSRLLVRPWWYI